MFCGDFNFFSCDLTSPSSLSTFLIGYYKFVLFHRFKFRIEYKLGKGLFLKVDCSKSINKPLKPFQNDFVNVSHWVGLSAMQPIM